MRFFLHRIVIFRCVFRFSNLVLRINNLSITIRLCQVRRDECQIYFKIYVSSDKEF
jgi:hypothetical protein